MVDGTNIEFTVDEIARAFFEATRQDEWQTDAMTTRELAAAVGHGEFWVRQRLRTLIAAGRWECVRVPKLSMAGTMVMTLAYRPREAK